MVVNDRDPLALSEIAEAIPELSIAQKRLRERRTLKKRGVRRSEDPQLICEQRMTEI